MDKKVQIKKFSESYTEEIDRNDWPNAPKIPERIKTPKEKLEDIKNLYLSADSGEITHEDLFNKLGNLLSLDNKFPGPTGL
mgnify:CR=1 FL=1